MMLPYSASRGRGRADIRRLPTPHSPGASTANTSSREASSADNRITSSALYGHNRPSISSGHGSSHLDTINEAQNSVDRNTLPYMEGPPPIGVARMTPLTEESVSCLDMDQSAGEPRFYGPTSQLYIHSPGHASVPSAKGELDPDISIDIESVQAQKQLFGLFWNMQKLSAAVVDERLFLAGRKLGERAQYHSKFLEYALLACASRSSTSSVIRCLGEKYVERAKAEVVHELECPNIASLQGFLLLSDFEATQGRDRVGWMYCGKSYRACHLCSCLIW